MRNRMVFICLTAALSMSAGAAADAWAGPKGKGHGGIGPAAAGGPPAHVPGAALKGGAGATTRGSADVLPHTRASERGVERGAMSTQHAGQAGVNANAAVDGSSPFIAGSVVKDSRGAVVGHVERMVSAPGGDRVVLRMGNELISVPASSLDASGKFLTTSRSKAQLRAQARGAGG